MKVLLVDDHPLWRESVELFLRRLAPEVEVLHAGSGQDAWSAAEAHQDLALALIDLQLRDADGVVVLAGLRDRVPALRGVMLTASESRLDFERSVYAGAVGFISKSVDHVQLQAAFERVMKGETCLLPAACAEPSIQPGRNGLFDLPATVGLTSRQREVLERMSQGHSNKLIAQELGIAEKTIKIHVSAIFRVLNVTNRTQAVMVAQGLWPPDRFRRD